MVWLTTSLQDCPNGKLTPQTFCDMYKMFFPAGDAEKFCENVFRTFDADKSGTIDFKEFLMAIDVTSAGTPREKLLWAFRSGTWSRDRRGRGSHRRADLNIKPECSALREYVLLPRMYDVDGNGVIDQDEMTKIVQVIQLL